MSTEESRKLLMSLLAIERRLHDIESQLFNKLRIAHILDVTDDRVHIHKDVVQMYETPQGVVVHVK